jgi:hypothetical protein
MKRLFVLVGAGMMIAGLVHAAMSAQTSRSKPTTHNKLFTDGRFFVPQTLMQIRAKADAIARVIINDGRSDDFFAAADAAVPLVATVYDVTVKEVLKPDSRIAPGSVAPVWRIGGKRDKGDYIELTDEDDFPLFKPGEEYVLFLEWKESRRAFEIVGGPNGAFRLNEGYISCSGTSPLAKQENGSRTDNFLNKVRTLR